MKKYVVLGMSGKAEHGKTTFCNLVREILIDKGVDPNVVGIYPLAKIMKVQALSLGWDGKKDEKGRRFLQEISWPIKHYHGIDIYAKWDLERALNDEMEYILVDDFRMLAEIDYFSKNVPAEDLIIARIERPGHVSKLTPEQLADVSETQLDDYPFETRVDNSGTIADLTKEAEKMADRLIAAHDKRKTKVI